MILKIHLPYSRANSNKFILGNNSLLDSWRNYEHLDYRYFFLYIHLCTIKHSDTDITVQDLNGSFWHWTLITVMAINTFLLTQHFHYIHYLAHIAFPLNMLLRKDCTSFRIPEILYWKSSNKAQNVVLPELSPKLCCQTLAMDMKII